MRNVLFWLSRGLVLKGFPCQNMTIVADTELKWANVTSKCCYQSIAELCTRQMICVCVLHVQLRMPVHRSQHKKGFGRLGMRKFCPSETIFGTCVLKTGKGGLSWGAPCYLLNILAATAVLWRWGVLCGWRRQGDLFPQGLQRSDGSGANRRLACSTEVGNSLKCRISDLLGTRRL